MKRCSALMTSALLMAGGSALAQEVNIEEATSSWPQSHKDLVQSLTEKYGEPTGAMESRVVWTEVDSTWDEIVVYKEEVNHDFPVPHQDYLEQSIFLEVPADKMDELSQFDGSVIVYRTEGRVAARCDREGANILALNLAHDIINDEKSVEEARQAYADAIMQMQSGQPPEIMRALSFVPLSANEAASSDETVIGTAATTASAQ